MTTGYDSRKSVFTDGDDITAKLFNDEYNALISAFDKVSGHNHDGTAGGGAPIPLVTGISGLAAGITSFLATPTSANLKGAVTDETGSGALVFATSPTLVTPDLGTPTSGVLTNATGLPISTGVSGLASGVATFLATPTSASLKTAVTDETGSGALVFAISPTLVTPILGTPTSGTLTNATGLPISTGVSGLGAGVATALAVNVGSAGALAVFNGALGTPSSGTVTNLTGTASININGTVGATTPSAAAVTTLTASNTITATGAISTDSTTDSTSTTTGSLQTDGGAGIAKSLFVGKTLNVAGNINNTTNRPAIKPTLLLDFANSGVLDPRITFTRASAGTYYDGVTTAKAEENLLLQSQNFSDALWIKDAITLSAVTAPDGTSTASKVLPSIVSVIHALYSNTGNQPKAVNTTYTLSYFLKADGYGYATISLCGAFSSIYVAATFDLSGAGSVTKTGVGGSGGTLIATSITSLTGGWYRCSVTGSVTQASGFDMASVATTGTPTYGNYGLETFAGDGVSAIQVWGAQLEQRSSVTAYTATTTQPITNYIPVLLTAAANQCRFQHNPVTGEGLGVLIEGAATNLLTYSEDFSNAAWGKSSSGTGLAAAVTANAAVAPDGTMTADIVTLDRGAGNSLSDGSTLISSAVSFIIGNSYAGGLYIKASSSGEIGKEIGIRHAGLGSYSIFVLTNEWQRAVSAEICPATLVSNIEITSRGGITSDNSVSFLAWGAQLEAGTESSYIKTVASAVTRAADSLTMTGTNFSDWYNQGEGTFYAEVDEARVANGDASSVLSVTDGSIDNSINIYISGVTSRAQVLVGGVLQAQLDCPRGSKYSLAVKADNMVLCVDGVPSSVDVSCLMPAVDRFSIGNGYASTLYPLNAEVTKTSYYPKRLPDAVLQAMTA